jgi:hypothetical protein
MSPERLKRTRHDSTPDSSHAAELCGCLQQSYRIFFIRLGWVKSCKLDSEEFLSMILPLRVSKAFRAVLKGAVPLGCGLLMLPAFGQQPLQTLLVGVDRRTVTSLDGDWHFLVDAPPAGALYAGNGQINDHGYALNTHPNLVGKHNQEYDFATAPTIQGSRRLEYAGSAALRL